MPEEARDKDRNRLPGPKDTSAVSRSWRPPSGRFVPSVSRGGVNVFVTRPELVCGSGHVTKPYCLLRSNANDCLLYYLASATWAWWPASDTACTNATPLSGVVTRPERISRNIM